MFPQRISLIFFICQNEITVCSLGISLNGSHYSQHATHILPPSYMFSPLYLCPPLLFSLSHAHSPGLLQSHSSPSNLYLGVMLEAPTHSHQAFQRIPSGCIAYHMLAFLTSYLCMHKPTCTDTFEDTQVCAESHFGG